MQPIPLPQLLDPDRLLLDDRNDLSAEEHADRATQLNRALHDTCSYAQQLWHELDAVRGYLLDSLPPDRRTADADAHGRSSAAPTGPDDEQGWQNWITAYSRATSALAGPHGDSGFGSEEARREARDRRLEPADAGPEEMVITAGPESLEPSATVAPMSHQRGVGSRSPVRLALRLAILALAVRGLRRPAG
jgi:hypothetical protein